MPTFKDKAGCELQPGDLIVYGHALGRCAGLQYGKVLEIRKMPDKTMYWNGNPISVPFTKIKVQGVDTDWGMVDWQGNERPPTLRRASVLEFWDRVLKIERNQVHPRVLELLDVITV